MAKGQQTAKGGMRPNIDISHTTNGKVKDYAANNDLDLSQAYRDIIEAGLDELSDQSDSEEEPDHE